MKPSDLSRFFVDEVDDEFPRTAVITRLYYEATVHGKYLRRLFPKITNAEIEALDSCHRDNLLWGEANEGKRSFYLHKLRTPGPYTHPVEKACARNLNAGEPVRRCQECGYDSSCVLCTKCFNPDDHVGHSITTYIATDLNNGICDCGDPLAFKPLNCLCAAPTSDPLLLPEDMKASLEHAIDVCLNVVLDVLEHSVYTVPCINLLIRNGKAPNGTPITLESVAENSRFSSEAYGKEEKELSNKWHLVVWNDEFHDYRSACRAITAAMNTNPRESNEMAETINDDGFAVLDTFTRPELFLEEVQSLAKSGLTVTVIPDRELNCQAIVDAILWWFKDITLIDHDPQFADLASSILARKLLEPDHKLNSPFVSTTFFADLAGRGLLSDGHIVNESRTKVVTPNVTVDSLKKRICTALDTEDGFTPHQSPLQLFLLYHNRMNKKLRQSMTDLLLSVLVKDPQTKETFSEHFMQIYPNLLWSLAKVEREEELSVLIHITPQLFTCPSTVRSIVEREELPLLLAPLAELIETTECGWLMDRLVYFLGGREEKFYSDNRCSRLAIGHGISNLNMIFTQARLYLKLESSWFPHFLFVMRPFQNFYPQSRKLGDHVGYEDVYYATHMSQAAPICELAAIVGQLPAEDKQENINVLTGLIEPQVQSEHTVSKDPTSFVHPYHILLSFMVEAECLPLTFSKQILFDPLNTIVLANQVKSHLWTRNGVSIMIQALLYFGSHMNHVTYHRDIFICQVAAAYEDPEEVLTAFLARWELLGWLHGDTDAIHTAYNEHFPTIMENFLVFLYIVVTDRAMLALNDEEHKYHAARMTVIYSLCEGPKPYSDLFGVRYFPDSKVDLDKILDEIADYQAPSALDDSGMYRLKSKILENIDPITRYLDYSQVQSVLDAMTQNIAKTNNIDEKIAVVKPFIPRSSATKLSQMLGEVVKLHKFAKLAFKLLQYSIDSLDHTYVYILLHLLHAAIAEDEEKHGPNHLNPPFIQVPLGSLLFVIAQLSFPASIVSKAKFLLDCFLEKSPAFGEELAASFGKGTVEKYTARNQAKSVLLGDEKKVAAEKRRLKVLKKFAKQRDAFMVQNEDSEDYKGAESSLSLLDNLRVCVFCGEKESLDALIGVLARKGDAPALSTIKEFGNASHFASYGENNILNAPPFVPSVEQFDNTSRGLRSLYSTCGHFSHLECFTRARYERPDMGCTLCHSVYDVLVPSFIFRAAPIEPLENPIISSTNKCQPVKDLVTSLGRHKSEDLINMLLLPEYDGTAVSDWARDLRVILKCDQGYGKVEFQNAVTMTEEIATTIQAAEVATRVEGDVAYYDFLSLVPGSVYTLVRALVQTRAVYTHPGFPGDYMRHSKKILTAHWNTCKLNLVLSPFTVMTNLFLQTDESFSALATMCFEMIICQMIVQKEDAFDDAANEFSLGDENIDPIVLEAIQTIGRILGMRKKDVSQLKTIYLIWEKMALTFLRQAVLFHDILTSTCVGENVFVCSKRFENLSSEIRQLPYLSCTKPLTDALGLRSFDNSLIEIASKIQQSGTFTRPWLGSFMAECPGAPRLINLPDDHFTCATYISQHSPRDNGELLMCLQCAKVLGRNLESLNHLKLCSNGSGIFYNPRRNEFTVVFRAFMRTVNVRLPGPYLTKHGEVRKWNSSENATLAHFRYEAINKLWVTQGLNVLASRVFLDSERRGRRLREPLDEPMIDDEMYDELLQNGLGELLELGEVLEQRDNAPQTTDEDEGEDWSDDDENGGEDWSDDDDNAHFWLD